MVPPKEELKIKCPKCPRAHTYRLDVRRSRTMSMLTTASFEQSSATKRFFTRLFTCPETGRDYQARFYLYEDATECIQSVSVAGVAREPTGE